jgi:hypothetical protein
MPEETMRLFARKLGGFPSIDCGYSASLDISGGGIAIGRRTSATSARVITKFDGVVA